MKTTTAMTVRFLVFFVATLLGASQARAITLCANSAQSLQSAFALARVSQEGVTIRIAKGTYAVPGLSLFALAPLTMLGGYDAGCTARPAAVRSADTVLDFGGYGVAIGNNDGAPISLVAIDGLSLANAFNLGISVGDWGDEGAIRLSRTRITGLPATGNPIVFSAWGEGSIRLDNVLMDALPGGMPSGECSVELSLVEGGVIEMVNSTIALPANQNLCLDNNNEHDSTANLYNSIVWSAIQTSAIDSTMSVVNAVHSTYGILYRHGGTGTTVGVLQTDPDWVDAAAGNYRLKPASTSVNSGTAVPPGGLAPLDIDGKPRWQGQLPDRGAYESNVQNAQTHLVTNTNDSGDGSLRAAMTIANQNPNLGIIEFDIPGGCPRVINLQSTLPKVTTPMLIDGMTQTGAVPNTDSAAFLPTLCVVVKPASGSLVSAFHAPADADDASLKLRGIAMGGFQQPVILAGGSDHVIAGNRFGGFNGGENLVGALSYSILVASSIGNGSFIIGGPGAADRNLVSMSTFSGIRIQSGVDGSQQHCQVVNNLIGTSGSGNTAAPNYIGISVAGTHCVIDGNRIVGNKTDGIVLENAFDTLIQRNIIGVTVNGGALPNTGAGIRFMSVAAGNVVGAPLSTYAHNLGNTIRYMAKAGIVLPDGAGNTLRGNAMRDNASGAGGLDIDLGDDGPTGNDIGDTDSTVGNRGQNFPTASKVAMAAGTAGSTTGVTATLTGQLDSAPGQYRIDAYFTNQCGASGARGHADTYLGGTIADNLQVFTQVVTLPNALASGAVSFTATDKDGNTSEMGTCFPIVGGSGAVFKDGFD